MKLNLTDFKEKLLGKGSIFSKENFQSLSVVLQKGAASRRTRPWLIGLALALMLVLISFSIVGVKSFKATEMIKSASELRVLSQNISKNASEAAAGSVALDDKTTMLDDLDSKDPVTVTNGNVKSNAFDELEKSRKSFSQNWKRLEDYRGESAPQMVSVKKVWAEVDRNAGIIFKNKEAITHINELARTLTETIPDLQTENEIVIQGMLRSNAPSAQITIAKQQTVLAERILSSVQKVLAGGADTTSAADSVVRDALEFERVLKGLQNSDKASGITQVSDTEAQDALDAIVASYDKTIKPAIAEIKANSANLFQVREASSNIFTQSQKLLEETTRLSLMVAEGANTTFYTVLGGGSLFIAIICFIQFVSIRANYDRVKSEEAHFTEKQKAEQIEIENRRNQDAILRLLDELGDLADGDLTVQATVTEDFTGAIADSINYSIDQLRGLVTTINQTAVQVSAAAQETQSTAMHLAEASEHQAQEIAGASAAVNEMAVSIDQVSANASESAAVAERSVAIAHKGAEVVQNTIAGMDTIREQIQETSKRIKRLGESSQEIGDIVSLINDIADQTNILALNAAIQASMAGEAGRGFAVVADEVQRLAERSAAATKQIEQLVKTIQTDTNEAVISMEQTTAEVVRGARLAQDAGVALGEIENVSRSLADLIQNISNAARQQAASAGHISNTMNVIQEITSQTTAGTIATARSIGNLAEMANELRHSVAGFKLPEHA